MGLRRRCESVRPNQSKGAKKTDAMKNWRPPVQPDRYTLSGEVGSRFFLSAKVIISAAQVHHSPPAVRRTGSSYNQVYMYPNQLASQTDFLAVVYMPCVGEYRVGRKVITIEGAKDERAGLVVR
jgi:hypothetical protein